MSASTTPTKQQRRDALRRARLQAEHRAAATAARRRRLKVLVGAMGAAAIVVAIAIAVSTGGGGTSAAERASRATTATGQLEGRRESAAMLDGIPQLGIYLGRPDAPVRFVEFADLQCPACRQYALSTLPVLVRDYVRTGKVRMEFRNLSFLGEDSVTLGRAASAAARRNRLWNFAPVLYFNQGEENTGYATPAFVDRILTAAGVDATDAKAFTAGRESTAPLRAADAMGRRYGINSTPSFLIGRRGGELAKVDSGALASTIDDLLGR